MTSLRIPSNQINLLSSTVKELVNQGIWFLYKAINIPDKKAAYILVTQKEAFILDRNGRIFSTFPKAEIEKNLGVSVYFTDIPLPNSLSNMAYA